MVTNNPRTSPSPTSRIAAAGDVINPDTDPADIAGSLGGPTEAGTDAATEADAEEKITTTDEAMEAVLGAESAYGSRGLSALKSDVSQYGTYDLEALKSVFLARAEAVYTMLHRVDPRVSYTDPQDRAKRLSHRQFIDALFTNARGIANDAKDRARRVHDSAQANLASGRASKAA